MHTKPNCFSSFMHLYSKFSQSVPLLLRTDLRRWSGSMVGRLWSGRMVFVLLLRCRPFPLIVPFSQFGNVFGWTIGMLSFPLALSPKVTAWICKQKTTVKTSRIVRGFLISRDVLRELSRKKTPKEWKTLAFPMAIWVCWFQLKC